MYYDYIIYEAKVKQSISQTTSNKVGLKSTYIWKRILNTKHSHKNAAEFFFKSRVVSFEEILLLKNELCESLTTYCTFINWTD